MNIMNSKQRVLTALSHSEPDRTPCNYLGTPEVDCALKKHFSTDNMESVLQKLGVDLRVVDAPYTGPELRKWPDGRFENYWGHIRKPVRNQAGTYSESVEFPYAQFQTIKDVEKFRWPEPDWFDYSALQTQLDNYREYAIVFGGPGNMDLINGTAFGRGVEQVMIDIATEDPVGMACMEKRFECCYSRSEIALGKMQNKVDIFWIGDDYGSQNGLSMNPKVWRKLFFPKLKSMCDLGHRFGARVMLHSCGSTVAIWPDLIEAGVDIYDTVQPEAKGMNPAELKQSFGNKICFHGTISTQKTLPFADETAVAGEVIARIKTVGKNGGFICAPAHNIQPDTPVENVIAIYNAVRSAKVPG